MPGITGHVAWLTVNQNYLTAIFSHRQFRECKMLFMNIVFPILVRCTPSSLNSPSVPSSWGCFTTGVTSDLRKELMRWRVFSALAKQMPLNLARHISPEKTSCALGHCCCTYCCIALYWPIMYLIGTSPMSLPPRCKTIVLGVGQQKLASFRMSI